MGLSLTAEGVKFHDCAGAKGRRALVYNRWDFWSQRRLLTLFHELGLHGLNFDGSVSFSQIKLLRQLSQVMTH